jgi:NADPH:quinone reductase-like Zn-dependent oxidoreductase
VTRFAAGDEVFGECIAGYGWRNGGAFAEHATAPAGRLVPKPARLTFEQAAALPSPGLIACAACATRASAAGGARARQRRRRQGHGCRGPGRSGNRGLSECRRVPTPDGTYVLIGHDGFGTTAGRWLGSIPRFVGLMARSPFVRQLPDVRFSMPNKRAALAVLAELADAGRLTPAIDSTYPLDEVPAAIRRLQSGDAVGKIVIAVSRPGGVRSAA